MSRTGLGSVVVMGMCLFTGLAPTGAFAQDTGLMDPAFDEPKQSSPRTPVQIHDVQPSGAPLVLFQADTATPFGASLSFGQTSNPLGGG